MRLIPDWKNAWRWHSTQILAALTVAPLVWAELPDDLKAKIPPDWYPWIIGGIALAGFVGRLRDQP